MDGWIDGRKDGKVEGHLRTSRDKPRRKTGV